MNGFLLAAAIASFITFGIHVFAGGRVIAAPLLKARDIPPVAKFTQYYCWHGITIVLFAMGAAFLWAARYPDGVELAWLATALAAAFMLWGQALIIWKKQSTRLMPQWILFALIAALGLAGLLL